MPEWWTYRLYDFLLFSPRTYYRLFELYNAAIWPAQIAAVAARLALVAFLGRGVRRRAPAAILAVAWLWVAVAFFALRYSTINWAATYAAWAFGVEAVLLLWIGGLERPTGFAGRAGLGILLFAVLIEPLIGPVLGRPFRQIELFALAPDPTAVGTLGALLLTRAKRRWLLMIVPGLWCLLTGLTLLAMSASDWWVAPAAALLSVTLATFQRRSGTSS